MPRKFASVPKKRNDKIQNLFHVFQLFYSPYGTLLFINLSANFFNSLLVSNNIILANDILSLNTRKPPQYMDD